MKAMLARLLAVALTATFIFSVTPTSSQATSQSCYLDAQAYAQSQANGGGDPSALASIRQSCGARVFTVCSSELNALIDVYVLGSGDVVASLSKLGTCLDGSAQGGGSGGGSPHSCKSTKHFARVGKPKISGNLIVGNTLWASEGNWKPAPDSVSFAWLANGSKLVHQGSDLTVGKSLVGSRISLRVTVRSACYLPVTSTSDISKPVTVGKNIALAPSDFKLYLDQKTSVYLEYAGHKTAVIDSITYKNVKWSHKLISAGTEVWTRNRVQNDNSPGPSIDWPWVRAMQPDSSLGDGVVNTTVANYIGNHCADRTYLVSVQFQPNVGGRLYPKMTVQKQINCGTSHSEPLQMAEDSMDPQGPRPVIISMDIVPDGSSYELAAYVWDDAVTDPPIQVWWQCSQSTFLGTKNMDTCEPWTPHTGFSSRILLVELTISNADGSISQYFEKDTQG